jgi:putative ABC transport system permease protein
VIALATRHLDLMISLLHDLRLTLRSLRRAPAFALLTIATLAIGIGPATAIFSIVESVLIRQLPYRDADSLVAVWRAREKGDRAPMSGPDFADFRRMNRSFSGMAVASSSGNFNVGDISEPVRVEGARVTPNFFALLGARPLLGEPPAGSAVRDDKLVILSEGLWRRSFGAANVIGKQVRLNGDSYRVVAVMPRAFAFPEKSELWVPFDLTPDKLGHRAIHQYRVIARLKSGVTVARASAEMNVIARQLAKTYPETTAGIDAWAMSLRDSIAGDVRKPLMVLFAAVVFLLFIACSNTMNLVMTRAAARERDVAVRSALGATEGRLARELLLEMLVLTIAGAAAGLVLAALALRLTRALGDSYFARPDLISIDLTVLLFNLGVAVLTGLAFSLVPLLSRRSRFAHLAGGARVRSSAGWSSRLVRESIVVAVVAFSFMLLIGAAVLMHSFTRLARVDIGVKPEQLVTMRIFLPPAKYPDNEVRTRITQQIIERLSETPGIDSVAAVGGLPLEHTMSGDIAFPNEGNFADARRIASFIEISPRYFRTAGIPLLMGRDFTNDDVRTLTPMLDALSRDPKAPLPPILINETMARRFWRDRSPIGQAVLVGGESAWRIVGVAGDVKSDNPREPTPPQVYLPLGTPLPPRPTPFLVRSSMSAQSVMAAMRRVMATIDPNVPPYQVRTMGEVISSAFAGPRFQTVLLIAFAATALLLAIVGIYGVTSYNVVQRTREIGVRVAFGASRRDVFRLVVGRVARLAAIGIIIGGAGAIALSRALESLVFEVQVADPRVFAAVATVLLLAAMAASANPARRATAVEPSRALRQE